MITLAHERKDYDRYATILQNRPEWFSMARAYRNPADCNNDDSNPEPGNA
jgi:hypothetical protein